MKEYTLRELCEECDVTRRGVQWYEKYGLIKSCGKNKQGYLLYDEEAVAKGKMIRALQNYCFSVSEIAEYFAFGNERQYEMLSEKAKVLRRVEEQVHQDIKNLEALMKTKNK